MRIGLDSFSAMGKGGNSTYTRELIRHLISAPMAHRLYLFGYAHDVFRPMFHRKDNEHIEVHTRLSPSFFPFPAIDEINEVLLRMSARMRNIDIFHFTNPLNIVAGPFKRVVTIHDLAALHDPLWTKEWAAQEFRKKEDLLMSSDAIIAVSKSTKEDIVTRFGVPAEKITVIYEGAGDEFFPDDDPNAIRRMVGSHPYIMCVGQLQPRKNNKNLIRAFGLLAPRHKDLRLVFAGRPISDTYKKELRAAAKESGVEDAVMFAEGFNNHSLRKLYSGALCMAYPSFFEGFGLPIVEAFACGTPVITSNLSSMPEVAGDAGLLIDPYSAEDIAGALERILTNEELRGRLRAAIPGQLRKFSWEKAAHETIQVYESLS